MIFRIHKQGRRQTAPPLRLSKKPRRVRARKREEIEICFRPRHVRGRKHISACKRANCPLIADGERAAAGRSLSVEKGYAFFDGLKARQKASPFSYQKCGDQRCLPMKNRATQPGPVWAPMTGPMLLMMISFTP